MRFGAYHFANPSGSTDAAAVASAVAQADYFLSVAQPLPGELLPALDVENAGDLSVARLTLWVQAWLDQVVARTGVRPLVYVSPSFWKTRLGDSPVVAVSGHRLWIAHWTKDALPILPGASWGGLGWSFWQWSNCQKIAGIVGCVDGDRFNGSSLASVVVPTAPAGPPARDRCPHHRRRPADRQAARAPRRRLGRRQTGLVQLPVAALRRHRARLHPDHSRDLGDLHADCSRRRPPLLVRVSAVGTGTASASSAPTLAVANSGTPGGTAPTARTLPSIEGSTQVGQTLTARPGTWTGSPTSFSYQWRSCATGGTACTAIDGAGGVTYTITPGDVGAALSLIVTAVGKGGAGSATSAPTAVIAPAPVPIPAVGTAIALAGQAGAVTTATNVAVATWQPGALPDQAAVGLADTPSHLALPRTAIRLSVGAPAPLPWPIDVTYTAAPADAVPGILPVRGVWQPLAQLPTPTLPAAQQGGTYRDAAGALHVLTRTAGRIALFAPGKWGDPRYATTSKPRLALVTAAAVKVAANRSATVLRQDHARHPGAPIRQPGRRRTARHSFSRRKAPGSAGGCKASRRRRSRHSSSGRGRCQSGCRSPPPRCAELHRSSSGSWQSTRTDDGRP